MIRITVDSDEVAVGVSTLARYIEKHLREVFDNVSAYDPELFRTMEQEVFRRNLHAIIGKQPRIEVIAHPRLAGAHPSGPLQPHTLNKDHKVKRKVFKQTWTESERGWGQRPDGYSLHLSVADMEAFNKEFDDTQPEGPAPDEYTRPDGNPEEVEVDDETYRQVKASSNGIRQW